MKLKQLFAGACLLLCSLFIQAQTELWYFGRGNIFNGAGIHFDAGAGHAPVQRNFESFQVYEAISVVGDGAGNPLFYSDGLKVYDGSHTEMPNGGGLLGSQESNASPVTGSSLNGVMIAREPGSSDRYVIMTINDLLNGARNGLRYSVVDMTLPGNGTPGSPLGDVDPANKNVVLLDGSSEPTAEMMTAAGAPCSDTTWIVVHGGGNNRFYSIPFTTGGVFGTPVTSDVGPTLTGSGLRGSLAFNSDASQLALAAMGGGINNGAWIFDFNPSTGVVSSTTFGPGGNGQISSAGAYGSAWSPDDEKVYFSSLGGDLRHFNTTVPHSGTNPSVLATGFYGAIELAPDGKMYVGENMTNFLGTISNPNAADAASAGWNANGYAVGTLSWYGLPNMFLPDLSGAGVDADIVETDGSVCDTVSPFAFNATPVDGSWSTNPAGLIDASTGVFDPGAAAAVVGDGGVVQIIFGGACIVPDTIDYTINVCCEPINVNDPAAAICAGETIDLSALVVEPLTGTWSIASGSGGSITGGNTFESTGALGAFKLYYSHDPAQPAGCQQYDSIEFTVNPLPTISLSSGPICDGETEVLDAGNPGSTYQWFTGGIAGGTAQTESVTTAGPHKVIVTLASGCIDSAETTVTVNANPDVSITAPSVSCDNESAEVLSATPSGGTWYINDVLSITGSFDPGALGASTHEIKYEYTDANGCSDVDSIDHDVNAAPSVSIDPISVSCSNEGVETMTASPVGGTWRIDGVSSTDAFDPSVHTGASSVRYTYTNGDGCTDSTELAVNINIAPDVTIDPISVSCDNEAAETMTASPSGGNWFINDVASTDSFDPSALGAATHEVKYTYTDGSGCSDSDSVDVTINAAPSVSIDPISVSCSNESVETMTASPSGGSWRIDGVSSTDEFDPSVHTGASTVRYTYTNGDGCTDSTELAVNINTAPDVTIDPISASCDNHLSETMTASPAGGNWYINDVASTDVFDPIALGASTHEVKYSYTDGSGCSDSDSVDVTINAIPVVTATIPAQFCQNEGDITFTGSPLGGDWVVNGSAATSPFAATDGSIGNNDVEYIYVDGNGCTDTARGSVDILSPPTASIDASNTVWCTNADVTLTGEPTTGVTYTWSGGGLSSTDPIVTIAGEGPFQLIVEDGNTCKDTTEVSFTAQLPNPDLGEDQNVCTGFETTLDPGVFVSYLWDDASTDPTRDVVAGFGYYWVEVTDAEGCTNRDSVEFTERHPFTVEIEGDTMICEYETATLTAVETPEISGGTYEWIGAIGSSETGYATSAGPVKVIVTDDANCTDSAEVTIIVNDRPDASFALNVDSFCSVGKETYQVVLMVDGDSSTVNYGDDYYTFTDAGDQETNRATYNYAPTVVYGSFTDTNGCMSTDTLALMEYCEPTDIQLPNVFVPGGGVTGNTTFRPINMNDENFIEIVNNIQWSDFVVYNRWGLKVFQSENLIPNWDGMFENQPVASGTYYWIYKYKDSSMKEYSYNGFVQVVQQLD